MKKRRFQYWSHLIFICLFLFPIILHISHSFHSNQKQSIEERLKKSGYSNTIVGGNSEKCPQGSGKHPSFHRHFQAHNSKGNKINGIICGTWYGQKISENTK